MNKSLTSLFTPFPSNIGGGGFEDQALPPVPFWRAHSPYLAAKRSLMSRLSLFIAQALILAEYYALPAVSMRNSMYTWLASNATDSWPYTDVAVDGIHPSELMQRAWASMLVHWLQVVLLLDEWFDASTLKLPLPPPINVLSYVTYTCFWEDSLLALASGEAARAPGSRWPFHGRCAAPTLTHDLAGDSLTPELGFGRVPHNLSGGFHWTDGIPLLPLAPQCSPAPRVLHFDRASICLKAHAARAHRRRGEVGTGGHSRFLGGR